MIYAEIDFTTTKMRVLVKKFYAKNLEGTFLFVDFSLAFDSIQRGKMEQILLASGLPKENATVIMRFYRNMKLKVGSFD